MEREDYDPTEDDRYPRCCVCAKWLDPRNLVECDICHKAACEACLTWCEGPREYHCTGCLAATFSALDE